MHVTTKKQASKYANTQATKQTNKQTYLVEELGLVDILVVADFAARVHLCSPLPVELAKEALDSLID